MQDVSIDDIFNQMKLPTIVPPTNDYEKMETCAEKNDSTKVKDELKNIIAKFIKNQNLYVHSNTLELNFGIFLSNLKKLELNFFDTNYLEKGLIRHFLNWNICFKTKIKLRNFLESDLNKIIKLKFFELFGDFELVLEKIENYDQIFQKSPIGLTFIEIYNKIDTMFLLTHFLNEKIDKNMKDLIFYLGMRLNRGPEVKLLKKIFIKNKIEKNLIKKALAYQSVNNKKIISKIFFKQEGESKYN